MRGLLVFVVAVVGSFSLALPVKAQEPQPRPTVQALAIDTPIRLDGVLDEAAWQQAERTGDFTQRQPEEFEPSTERTEFRVVYTPETLYIGFQVFDSEPDKVVGKEMGRDSPIFRDDGLVVLLDTFHDERNAYFFETNPNGSRTDGLVTDEGRDFNIDWDGIWDVVSKRTAEGWVAEMAIPFRTLRFDPGNETWGLQVRRIIKRKNEITFWSPIGRDAGLFRMSRAGTLTGLAGLETGRNLRIKPYLSGTSSSSSVGGESGEDVEGGLDVKWGITQGLTLDLTVNTDFAETEVDEQQTNLTRFSLFFPEKREFFLENAGIFEFGPSGRPLLKVFFSRRIGISDDGRQVDVEGGLRLAGRQGPWSLGVLTARTGSLDADLEEDLDAVPTTDWAVVRVKRNLGRRSNIGFITTQRDQGNGLTNRVLGFDADIKPTDQHSIWAYGVVSDEDTDLEDDWSAGLGASWRGSFWSWSASAREIGDDFTPGTGFLLRTGRNFEAEVEWQPRPDWSGIRNLSFELEADVFTTTDGKLESVEGALDLFGVTTDRGDFFLLFAGFNYERLFEPFEIFEDVVLPADEYRWEKLGFVYETNEGRPLSINGFAVTGEFFDGNRLVSNLTLNWRPSRYFRSQTTWVHNDVDLPAGEFSTNVLRQRFGVSLNPDLVFDAFVQHNDAAELLSLNFRVNWHYRPGSDLFVVYNQGWDAPSIGNLATRDRQLIVKMTYSLDV